MILLLIVTLALWGAGWLLLGRMKLCAGKTTESKSAGHLSIIIPARNEEHNLPTLLDSLSSQSVTAAEIIVAGIEKNKYHILVGSDAKMMDFFSRLMPERAAKMIYSQMRSLLPG